MESVARDEVIAMCCPETRLCHQDKALPEQISSPSLTVRGAQTAPLTLFWGLQGWSLIAEGTRPACCAQGEQGCWVLAGRPSASRLLSCSQPSLWSRWGRRVWAVLSSQRPASLLTFGEKHAGGKGAASLCPVSPQLTGNRFPRC